MSSGSRAVGNRIMQKRKELNYTQEVLSEKIGISKNHLSSIERGKFMPTTQLIFRICEVLGGTPNDYLIGTVSLQTDETLMLIRQLPSGSQKIVHKLLETYLAEIQNNNQ